MRMPTIAASGAAAGTAFVAVYRPWHSRWGATDEEVAAAMPGDEVETMASARVDPAGSAT